MKVSLPYLKNLLLNNVCEVRFERRRSVPERSGFRRMICTNSRELLNTYNGKMVLHYRPVQQLPKYNPDALNLIISWDILMQDYRQINMWNCDLVKQVPANEEFWEYFNKEIHPMTTMQKMYFMES